MGMATSDRNTTVRIEADWIGADWTPSGLTIWAMTSDGAVLAETSGPAPRTARDKEAFDAAFTGAIGAVKSAWHITSGTPILVAGPFAQTPRPVPTLAVPDTLSSVWPALFPALSQETPRHLTLGMEAAIAGFVSLTPKFDGVLCLPGPRETVWAHISAEEVVSFRSVSTGMLLSGIAQDPAFAALLTSHAFDDTAFADAVSDAMSRPEQLTYRLASLEAETLLAEVSVAQARSVVLGLLIGAELAATRPYWLGQPIALIGEADLRAPYVTALEAQYTPLSEHNRVDMVRAGLFAAYRKGSA